MGKEGRVNTVLAISGLASAIGTIREDVIKATSDGHIDRQEALTIFRELAIALIHEGLQVALTVAQNKSK